MKKWIVITFLLTAIFLSACAQQNQASEVPTDTVQVTEVVQTAQPTSGAAANDKTEASCTVRTAQPTPGPTQQALLPPPTEDDWKTGPDNAYITLIEYGDYQ